MLQPKLTNFSDFIEKPKPVKVKTKFEIQNDINLYLNIALFLIVIIGILVLYYRGKYKKDREENAKKKISEFEEYMNDYIIYDMLEQQKYNIPY